MAAAPAPIVETFEHIIRRQGIQELMPFLLALDKKDAIAVRGKTKALKTEMETFRQLGTVWGRAGTDAQLAMLFLAGLATYSRKEAMTRSFEIPWNFHYDDDQPQQGHKELFLKVLRHSRPDWLADWLARLTRSNPWQVIDYRVLRELHEAGLLNHEPWLFAQALAGRLTRLNRTRQGHAKGYDLHLLRQLQADTVLLQRDVPLLFDFDTPVDSALVHGGKSGVDITWLTLLSQLAESGHLDRADLLTRSLLALRRDFRRPLLTWFKNLFLALKPTPAERLARQGELVELLAHPLPLVVNFALDQLKGLWADAAFDPAPLLLAAEGLMARQDLKTSLRTLLGGFDKLLRRTPALASTLARLATDALANADAAVQERAAKLLAGLLGAKKPLLTTDEAAETTAAIGLYADLLSAGARAALTSFLEAGPAAPAGPDEEAEHVAYAPLTHFRPDLSAATAVAPVRDWHELLFLTGQVIKPTYAPANLERWLDGLLRLRRQYPEGYADQLRPFLPPELLEVVDLKIETPVDVPVDEPVLLRALLVSWFFGFAHAKVAQVPPADTNYSFSDPLLQLNQWRLSAAEARLHPAATPLPLLSTPTHAPHWIAPAVLVEKLLAYEAAGQAPDAADLVLALARTAFQADADAARARAALPPLRHQGLRELLAWFLAPAGDGGPASLPADVGARPGAGKTVGQQLASALSKLNPFRQSAAPAAALAEALPWLWAVAARTRHPAAELPELRPLADYPGVAAPWQPAWDVVQQSELVKQSWWQKERAEYSHTWQELHLLTPRQPREALPSPLLLYSLHCQAREPAHYYRWRLRTDLPLLLSLLPQHPAPLHWHVLRAAASGPTETIGAEARDCLLRFLEAQLGAGPVLDEPALLLLAVGLTHAAPACRALALEVLLAAIGHQRLRPAELGAALGQLLKAGFVPLARLTATLAPARGISSTTDDALRQVLEALLPALPAAPPLRHTRPLLDLYADLRARRAAGPVPATVQARLREWSGTAALKKAALAVLAAT